jgi:hypothetical protein
MEESHSANFICEKCNYVAYRKSNYKRHLKTQKHQMMQEGDINSILNGFHCEQCDFHCENQYNYRKHLRTRKHKINTGELEEDCFECLFCEAYFKTKSNLKRHCIRCIGLENQEVMNRLIDQNMKLIEMMRETKQNNQIMNMNNSCNTTNNFNLQFFLNDTCKDAMNMSEFVRSIQVSMEDLEHTGREGYVNGISNIIVNRLNKIEQPMRPLHCSDLKREVLYIKENNEWMKETEGKPMLTNAIRLIANENMKQISKWRDNHPNCTRADSKSNDLYLKIVSNSMNGLTEEESDKNINKIINNVAKKVIIKK